MFPTGKRPSFADAFAPDIEGTKPVADEPVEEQGGDKVCPTCGASCAKIEAASAPPAPAGGMDMGPLK